MSDLQSWLKANKLSRLASKLEENDCEELEDLQGLESVDEIKSFASEMGLNTMLTKKFMKAVMKLNNITHVSQVSTCDASATPPGTQTVIIQEQKVEKKEEKKEEKNDSNNEGETTKPKRKRLNIKGVHAVNKLKRLSINKRHRTIMVIGATGTGKTTLLNSMMNYLWQVEYEDPYRFKLIYEELKKHGQAESVTDNVTAYYLDPPALDYQLTVIDTPGFGDTRGYGQDQKITKKIKTFFEQKIQEIDAICFVIRAPQARLTATQKYIFAQVLGIFGNDIADNILILMTFADGKKPPALAALKAGNVPFKKSFKLNNSAFDLPEDDDEDMFSQMFWKLGMNSFDKLFKSIDQLKTKSLMLTRKVLSRREELENYVTSVQPTIRTGFSVLDKLRQQINVVQKYGDLINENKDFEYWTSVPDAIQTPNNGSFNTTTCLTCNFTCHKRCAYSDNADKQGCCAISGEYCTCCPSKCHWTIHKNMAYTIEWTTKRVKKTSTALKNKYVDSTSKKSAEEQIMCGLVDDLAKVEQQLNGLINNVRNCLNELAKIALRPNILTQDDYIDKLIQSEEAERKPGYQKRIGALRQLKEKQDMLSKLNNDKYDPWKQYSDVQNFVKSNNTIKNSVSKNKKRNNRNHKSKGMMQSVGSWFGF